MAPPDHSLGQRAVAEFIGTFTIVFFGAGAVAIDILTAPEGAGDGTFVFNGLGFGSLGWVGVALAFWAAVTVPIYVFGSVSGQHINPAVTFALWLTDRIESTAAGVYVVAQLLGGVAGAVVFVLIRGSRAATMGVSGATAPFPGVSVWQAFANEIVITFFLMLTVMALAIDEDGPGQHAGLVIGFVVAMGVLTTGNISGASFNPARTIGPYVSNTVFGGPNFWPFVWVYVFGPAIGAAAGALLYDSLRLGGISLIVSSDEQSEETDAGRSG
jgi:glycerol uptake facilitator protein